MAERRYWLFKSEPNSYSFSDLLAEENRTDYWDGIRNYQVRNMMRDEIKAGDGGTLLPQQRQADGGYGHRPGGEGSLPGL